MNGPLKMYEIKQIVRHGTTVELPQCMYKVKNIHAARNGLVEQGSVQVSVARKNLDISDQNSIIIPEMAALEARQEQILQQLAELKKQMSNIRSHLKISEDGPSSTIIKATCSIQSVRLPSDIIINASPTHPPYSLLVVQKLFQSVANFSVKTHLHSSVSSLSEKAVELSKALERFSSGNGACKVNVKLIWKNVDANMELIVSPLHTPILGEVNLLRYLARLSPDLLNYENTSNPEQIDALLDTSYSIVRAKTKTERAGLLQNLSKSIGKSQFLAERNNISVADLAAFSAIKQTASPSEVNVGLTKWLHRCETYFC